MVKPQTINGGNTTGRWMMFSSTVVFKKLTNAEVDLHLSDMAHVTSLAGRGPKGGHTGYYDEEEMSSLLNGCHVHVWVDTSTRRLVGYIAYTTCPDEDHRVYADMFFILPEYRKFIDLRQDMNILLHKWRGKEVEAGLHAKTSYKLVKYLDKKGVVVLEHDNPYCSDENYREVTFYVN